MSGQLLFGKMMQNPKFDGRIFGVLICGGRIFAGLFIRLERKHIRGVPNVVRRCSSSLVFVV